MTVSISLDKIAAQNFTIVIDGLRYDVTIKVAFYYMICDIKIDGVKVISGQNILNGEPLLPYPYLENGGGNFIFLSDTEEDPWYENFGGTDILVYIERAELVAARGG